MARRRRKWKGPSEDALAKAALARSVKPGQTRSWNGRRVRVLDISRRGAFSFGGMAQVEFLDDDNPHRDTITRERIQVMWVYASNLNRLRARLPRERLTLEDDE